MMEFFLLCLVLQLFLTGLFTSGSSADAVTCTVGDDCDLPCSGPQGEVLVLEWTKDKRYLLLYRRGRIIQNSQDQRFRGRVHLRGPELRTGDMTVTLKNLTLENTGTYICEGLVETSGGKREVFTREVHLRVSERTEGQYAARTDERGGQNLNDEELRHSNTDDVPEAANKKHLAVTPGVSERTEDTRSGKGEGLDMRMPDSDVPDAANRKHLAVILGVTLSAVVICAVAAGVYWKRKTITDPPQKKKNLQTTLLPTTESTPDTSSTPFP